MDFPDHPFWDYSLALYGRPAVKEACLRLQDGPGLDVNLILFACWTASRGGRLSPGDWRRLIDGGAAWRGNVAEPLRAVRRYLKTAADAPRAAGLRERVLALELDAEHTAQLAIAALAGPADSAEGPPDPLTGLLDYAAAQGAVLSGTDRDDLSAVAQLALSDTAKK